MDESVAYQPRFRELFRRRFQLIGVLLLACALALIEAIFGLNLTDHGLLAQAITVGFGVAFVVTFVRLMLFRCPRCAKLFFGILPSFTVFRNRCAHCGLVAG